MSADTQPVVVKVRGEPVVHQSHARKLAGLPATPTRYRYRYIAVLANGTEEVIRDQTRRRYAWADRWSYPVNGKGTGLAAYFTFGRGLSDRGALRFRIEWR